MATPLRPSAALLLATLSSSCSRAPASEATAPTADAAPAPAASPAPSPSVDASSRAPVTHRTRVRLAVETERAGGPPVAFLVSDELAIHERVGEIPFPFTCQIGGDKDAWTVTCTPDARAVKLTIKRADAELTVARPGGASKTYARPDGGVFSVESNWVAERMLPEHACAEDAPTGDAAIEVLTHGDYIDKKMSLQLIVPGAKGPAVLRLFDLPDIAPCKAEGEGVQRKIVCGGRDECTLAIGGASLAFSCAHPAPVAGRVLLKCGATAKLPSGLLRQTVHYN